jgi:hypothetical protein
LHNAASSAEKEPAISEHTYGLDVATGIRRFATLSDKNGPTTHTHTHAHTATDFRVRQQFRQVHKGAACAPPADHTRYRDLVQPALTQVFLCTQQEHPTQTKSGHTHSLSMVGRTHHAGRNTYEKALQRSGMRRFRLKHLHSKRETDDGCTQGPTT